MIVVNMDTCKQSSSTEGMNVWTCLCDTGYVDCLEIEGRNLSTGPSDLK